MIEFGVRFALAAMSVYSSVGVVVALLLHLRGLKQIDPATTESGIFFCILITPGVIALWPVMLTKWSRAQRGLETAGPNDRPAPPHRQRALHGLAFKGLAVAVPLLIGLALYTRPAFVTSAANVEAYSKNPAPLPKIEHDLGATFAPLPIQVRVLANESGRRQIELVTASSLPGPAFMLYWTSDTGANVAVNRAVYLGSVWAYATRRFNLPAGADKSGTFILYTPAETKIIATAGTNER